MGYSSSSTTWQRDSMINKYNTWFILCTEALKYLDRPGGVSVDEIKYFFKKTKTHLNDSQISVALIKGLTSDIFRTKNGRFFLNKHLRRIFFAETKEKFKLVKLKAGTLNKRKRRQPNKKYNRERKWRQQFDIDEISDSIDDAEEIDQNQNMINCGNPVISDHIRQQVAPFSISSNEDLEEGELLTDSDETENTKDKMVSYPTFYNHINETKQINFVSLQKRKWSNNTNKHNIKKTRNDNYQPPEEDKMSEEYFKLNVANKTDKCTTPSLWYKENYRKQISVNRMSGELGKVNGDFKEKQDDRLDILSKLKDKHISSRKRWRSYSKKCYQNMLHENIKPIRKVNDKIENIKPIRKVKVLKEKLSNYRSSVTTANGSANGIKYPKSIIQKCLSISAEERMALEEEKHPHNETIDEHLETNRNLNNSDNLERLKQIIGKKTKLSKQRRNKKVLEELVTMGGKEFEKITAGENVENSTTDNLSNENVETKKHEEKYKLGFALWRYFNPQQLYYEHPVNK